MTYASSAFLDTFLDPPIKPGCGHFDHGPDCLCDVDITRVAGMQWDQYPPDMPFMDTPEELVEFTASLWQAIDVPYVSKEEMSPCFHDPDTVVKMREAMRQCWTREQMEEAYGEVAQVEWELLKYLFSPLPSRSGRGHVSPETRIMELHHQGLWPAKIARTINEEGSWPRRVGPTGVGAVISRHGETPHHSPWHHATMPPPPDDVCKRLYDSGYRGDALHLQLKSEGYHCARWTVRNWSARYRVELQREAS